MYAFEQKIFERRLESWTRSQLVWIRWREDGPLSRWIKNQMSRFRHRRLGDGRKRLVEMEYSRSSGNRANQGFQMGYWIGARFKKNCTGTSRRMEPNELSTVNYTKMWGIDSHVKKNRSRKGGGK